MATVLITHEIEDLQQWLNSRRREEFFGGVGFTVRTFVDPSDDKRVALIAEGPGLEPLLKAVETPEAAAALKADGVHADTIQTYVER